MGRNLERMPSKLLLKKDVTVIIPCYNAGFSILRTLQSLKSQTYKNFNIIIINDGSTDSVTLKILKDLKQKNVKVINQKNKGLSIARNVGILESKTKFILPLDSDDWLASDAIESFVKVLLKNKNLSFVYSNIVNQNQSTGVLKKNFNFFEQHFSNQIPYCMLIRRSILIQVGLYDENMKSGFEDWELNIRLGKNGFLGFCINKNLFFYNVSDEGMLKSLSIKNFATIYLYIRDKHNELFKFKNLFSTYCKNFKIKSTHVSFFYFFYNIFFYVSSKKLFNSTLALFVRHFSKTSKLNKLNKKELINKKYKVKKIAHVITSLDVGGAETALVSLLEELKKNKKNFIPSIVICLKDQGYFYKKLIKLNVKVYCLHMKPNKINFLKQFKLYKILKKENPDIVQTWMYHSDLVGSIAASFANIKNIIWTIHNFNLTIKALGFQTKLIVYLCAILSYIFPKKIISVSQSAIQNHLDIGYSSKNFFHISLGYKDSKKKLVVVKKNKPKLLVFGSLSRWNVQKNHKFMLESFGKYKKKYRFNFKLILAGYKLNYDNLELLKIIKKNNLSKEVVLLDWVEDKKIFFSRIDVHILTSIGEAFPNVVCESMLSRVPCISSNVGDVANILGSTGWMFEVNNYQNLETILDSVFEEFRRTKLWNIRKNLARNRIVDNFGLDLMLQNYYQVWKSPSEDKVIS